MIWLTSPNVYAHRDFTSVLSTVKYHFHICREQYFIPCYITIFFFYQQFDNLFILVSYEDH